MRRAKQVTTFRPGEGARQIALEISPEVKRGPDGRVELHVFVHQVGAEAAESDVVDPTPARARSVRAVARHEAPETPAISLAEIRGPLARAANAMDLAPAAPAFERGPLPEALPTMMPLPPPSAWERLLVRLGFARPSLLTCTGCAGLVHREAACCIRCGTPTPKRILPYVQMAMGLMSVAVVFGVCAHYLGQTAAGYVAPKSIRDSWTVDDETPSPNVVNTHDVPSPFGTDRPIFGPER